MCRTVHCMTIVPTLIAATLIWVCPPWLQAECGPGGGWTPHECEDDGELTDECNVCTENEDPEWPFEGHGADTGREGCPFGAPGEQLIICWTREVPCDSPTRWYPIGSDDCWNDSQGDPVQPVYTTENCDLRGTGVDDTQEACITIEGLTGCN